MAVRTRIWIESCVGAVGLVAFVVLAQAYVDGGDVVSFDDNVARWVAREMPSSVEWVARVVTRFGGVLGSGIVAVLAIAVLWRASRRIDAWFVAAAVVGVNVLVWGLKSVYERARPDLGSPIDLPHSYSFPSGHAATSVALYGALGVLAAERARSRLRGAAWLVAAGFTALAIGVSRVVLNVHFVSDVLAGFAVGLAWLCCCLIVRDVVLSGRSQEP